MTATIVELRRPARLECSLCGAKANASCDCGAEYLPASERAAKAVAANPQKSDRAIAAEIGVDHKTVGKARNPTGERSPVEKRVGADGKARRLPQRQERYEEPEDDIEDDDGDKASTFDGTSAQIAEKIFSRLSIRKARKVVQALDKRLKAIKADCRACGGTGYAQMHIFTPCGMPTEVQVRLPCDCGPEAARHVAAAEARAQQLAEDGK